MGIPKHTDKHVQHELEAAAGKGWRVEKCPPRAHCWARIYCPHGHPDCMMSIWGTPRQPQNHAKQIARKVRKCPGAHADASTSGRG